MTKARNIADLGSNDVLETTATGVDVTGTLSADGLDLPNGGFLNSARNSGSLSLPILGHPSGSDTVRYLSSDGHSFVNGSLTKALQIANNGDVSFYEDTGTTAKMVWDSSAESLGIGTASPSSAIHVKGGSTTTSTSATDFIANSTARLVTNHANEYGAYIGYINSSNDAIAINSMRSNGVGAPLSLNTFGGNVGIGTDSPERPLHIASATPYIVFEETDASQKFTLGTGGGKFFLYDETDSAQRITVDTSGNVGIGNSSPETYDGVAATTALVVGGTAGNNGVNVVSGSTSTGSYMFSDSGGNDRGGFTYYHTADLMTINTGGSERARIDGSGNFGIGTSNPAYKLVVSDSGGAGLEVVPQTSNNRVTLLSYDRANTAYRQINFDGSESIFYTNGTERVRIASNGNLLVGTANSPSITNSLSVAGRMFSAGTYANNSGAGANLGISSSGEIYRSTSSLRYKTDVQDAQHGLTEVMTLRPVTYRGINDGDTVFGGLIAEEVHDAGLTEFVEYNEDNEPDALAYANMVSLCIKAIQEQQEIIENLKSRIETLENN